MRSNRRATVAQIAEEVNTGSDRKEREHQNWTTEEWKKVAWSDESRFLLNHVDGRVHVHRLPGEHVASGCTMGSRRRQCHALGNVMLGNLGSCHPCGYYFDTYHLPKHCCRPCTPFHGNAIP
ncbi:hypothetical protein QTP86_031172 [Hemibagrus guttatus]|nr:hypothetical protein QTP86_031172 [Hemibagrus guttatus]